MKKDGNLLSKWICTGLKGSFFAKNEWKILPVQKMALLLHPQIGALAHLVERNTGSVEVSGSSPLCSTSGETSDWNSVACFFIWQQNRCWCNDNLNHAAGGILKQFFLKDGSGADTGVAAQGTGRTVFRSQLLELLDKEGNANGMWLTRKNGDAEKSSYFFFISIKMRIFVIWIYIKKYHYI